MTGWRLQRLWPKGSRPAAPTASRDSRCRRPALPESLGRQNHSPNGLIAGRSRRPSTPWRLQREPPREKPSFDGDLSDLGLRAAAVVRPGEDNITALGRDGEKSDERV